MAYQSNIRKAFGLLYPTGRAWQYARGSEDRDAVQEYYTDGTGEVYTDGIGEPYYYEIEQFEATIGKRLIDAKLKAFDDAYAALLGVTNSILPDNDYFDEIDATKWEQTLRLLSNISDLEERKKRISQKLNYPNGVVERLNKDFIQEQLQAAGFNVYITENRFWNGTKYEVADPDDLGDQMVQYGLVEYGASEYGGTISGVNYTGIVANFVDEDLDNEFFTSETINPPQYGEIEYGASEYGGLTTTRLDRDIQLQASFFVGGSSFPSFVNIDINRKEEFRQLLLKLKPMHTLGFLYINYI